MNTFKNIGLVVNGNTSAAFHLAAVSKMKGYVIQKVLLVGEGSEAAVRNDYPGAEFVKDKQAIIQDANIELVVVAASVTANSSLVSELLQSGKSLRIVSPV